MTSKLTTVVANGSKPADTSIPMIEIKRNGEDIPLVQEDVAKDNNGVDLVPIMDKTDDNHETHF